MLKSRLLLLLVLLTGFAGFAQPVVQFIITSATVSEGVGYYGVAVEIANPNANPTSVDINVLPGGTAYNNTNFTYNPVTVTFPANSQFNQIVNITVIDDSIADGNKYFTFKLANATNNATVGADSEFVLTMINDDTVKLNLPVTALTVPKDTGLITFPVNLNPIKNDTITSVQVNIVANGTTAVPGVDYLFNDTTISWDSLTRGIIQVPVTILNDALSEPDRTIQFTLANPTTGVLLTDSIFTLNILEDDTGPPVILQFNMASDTVANPDSTYTIYPVSVQFYDSSADTISFIIIADRINSTAVDGNIPPSDYNYGNQPFTFIGPGSFTYNMSFNVFNDPQISPTKMAIFRFVDVSGNVKLGSDSVFTLYITNQNKLIVSFLGAGFSYPKDTPDVFVPVVLSTFATIPISADVTLAPGSAIYGQDFTFNDTTVIFPAFSSDTQGVWVHIINNSIYQPNKQINFNLSDPTNGAILGISGYTLTIINDDSLLGISTPDLEKLYIYPNPAQNSLFIQNSDGNAMVKIINTLGQTVLRPIKLHEDMEAIDISALAPGIYVVSIISADKTFSQRFIKRE